MLEVVTLNLNQILLDRGGLNILSKEFIERMWTIYRFVESAIKKQHNTKKICEDLVTFLVPHITACSTFSCIRGKQLPPELEHNEQLAILVLWKFINPMLKSYAATATDLQTKAPTVSKNKISNRKYSTLSKWKYRTVVPTAKLFTNNGEAGDWVVNLLYGKKSYHCRLLLDLSLVKKCSIYICSHITSPP